MTRLQGAIYQANTDRIEGWVRDADHFSRIMTLEVIVDGKAMARFVATPAGEGASTRQVFHLAAASLLLRGACTHFALRDVATGLDVPGSPFEIADNRAISLPKRRTARPVAVFVDERAPAPWMDGGSTVALSHIRALRGLGFVVIFLALEAPEPAALAPARAAGAWCPQLAQPWPADALLRHINPPPAVMYLHRLPTAARLLPLLRLALPHARILHAAADLQWLRMERGGAAVADVVNQRWIEETLLGLPDAVLVHSAVEAALLRGIARSAAVVPWAMPIHRPPAFAKRRGYAFVGGFDHAPNLDAVELLALEVVPLLAGRPVGSVYGSAMPRNISSMARPGLRTVGPVDDIVGSLHKHRATIAPLRFGAGIKVKVVQSLACGLPCVMTPIAAEGLDLPSILVDGLVHDQPAGMARALRAVCADEGLNAILSEAGMAYIKERFSEATTARAIASALLASGDDRANPMAPLRCAAADVGSHE